MKSLFFLWCSEEPFKSSLRAKLKELSFPHKRWSGIATNNQCPDIFAVSSVKITRDLLLLSLGSLWRSFYIRFYHSLPPSPCFPNKVWRSSLSHSDYILPWAHPEQRKCRDASGTWPAVNLMPLMPQLKPVCQKSYLQGYKYEKILRKCCHCCMLSYFIASSVYVCCCLLLNWGPQSRQMLGLPQCSPLHVSVYRGGAKSQYPVSCT